MINSSLVIQISKMSLHYVSLPICIFFKHYPKTKTHTFSSLVVHSEHRQSSHHSRDTLVKKCGNSMVLVSAASGSFTSLIFGLYSTFKSKKIPVA